MKRRILFNLLCLLLLTIPLASMAQSSEGQTRDPLTVSGTVGTQITSSWNNADLHYSAPFSTTAYADMTFNLFGISVPMSVNLINTSAEQFAFEKPVFTINFRPTYKKYTFHVGTSCMNFSNYTYNGISFTGAGVEYRGDIFRYGGFYGNFNHATTFRTDLDDRDAIQYLSDSLLGMNNVAYTTLPQFTRKAYAAHVAFGSMKNFVDLSLVHARDNLESLPTQWTMYTVYPYDWVDTTVIIRDSLIKAKENLAVGLKGHFTFGDYAMFEANFGASLFSPDITREEMEVDGVPNVAWADVFVKGLRKTRMFNLRYGSEIRFAGDALLRLNLDDVTAIFSYRFVQPDYTSLGATGFNQNAQTFGGNLYSPLFDNTAFLSLNAYLQRDNLDGNQIYTNQVGSYTVNWNNFFGENLALAVMYNAVTQNQFDGVLPVQEDMRIDQITHSLDISPSYTLSLDNEHTFNMEFNLLQNKNRNKEMEAMSFDVTTTSYGLGYEVYLLGTGVSIDANCDYSQSRSPGNDYDSYSLSGGTSYNFIDNEDMTLSGNARLTMAYNVEKYEYEDISDTEKRVLDYLAHRVGREVGTEITNDLSVAARLGASLIYKDRHNASLYFAVSNYSDNIIIGQHVAVNTDVRFMLEYSYSFASRLIKSNKR